jgi:hypothetical protein
MTSGLAGAEGPLCAFAPTTATSLSASRSSRSRPVLMTIAPVLAAPMAKAHKLKGPVVVAKLDRLSRSRRGIPDSRLTTWKPAEYAIISNHIDIGTAKILQQLPSVERTSSRISNKRVKNQRFGADCGSGSRWFESTHLSGSTQSPLFQICSSSGSSLPRARLPATKQPAACGRETLTFGTDTMECGRRDFRCL